MLMLSAAGAQGQPMKEANKTLSQYFFFKSDDPGVDQLPLQLTSADVKVVGMIAGVVFDTSSPSPPRKARSR